LKHGVHIIARLEGAASSAPKLGPARSHQQSSVIATRLRYTRDL
jgi:hypothetical protein